MFPGSLPWQGHTGRQGVPSTVSGHTQQLRLTALHKIRPKFPTVGSLQHTEICQSPFCLCGSCACRIHECVMFFTLSSGPTLSAFSNLAGCGQCRQTQSPGLDFKSQFASVHEFLLFQGRGADLSGVLIRPCLDKRSRQMESFCAHACVSKVCVFVETVLPTSLFLPLILSTLSKTSLLTDAAPVTHFL